jgi:Na+-translocating ferredoxin:NAD+ oxidoreductase subunit B
MVTAEAVDALLPQTQCTRCGYSGCRPYAEAIVAAGVPINQCPPGGAATIASLAVLLARAPLPLNPHNGTEGPLLVARIDEEACIGCAKCLPPCPVDAIVGAQRQMHTVLTDVCTGCELCVAPCPVDCIEMVARADIGTAPSPEENRSRYALHLARAAARGSARAALVAERKHAAARG